MPPVSTAEETGDDNSKDGQADPTTTEEVMTTVTSSNETVDVNETILATSAETVIISDGGGDDNTSFLLSWACPTAVAVCVCTILAFALVWKVRKNPRELTKAEVQEFVEGPGKFGDFLGEELYINSRYLAEQYEVALDTIAFGELHIYSKNAWEN